MVLRSLIWTNLSFILNVDPFFKYSICTKYIIHELVRYITVCNTRILQNKTGLYICIHGPSVTSDTSLNGVTKIGVNRQLLPQVLNPLFV